VRTTQTTTRLGLRLTTTHPGRFSLIPGADHSARGALWKYGTECWCQHRRDWIKAIPFNIFFPFQWQGQQSSDNIHRRNRCVAATQLKLLLPPGTHKVHTVGFKFVLTLCWPFTFVSNGFPFVQHYFYNVVDPHQVAIYSHPANATNDALWQQTVRENPNPSWSVEVAFVFHTLISSSSMVPALAIGFDDLHKRVEAQDKQATLHQEKLKVTTSRPNANSITSSGHVTH